MNEIDLALKIAVDAHAGQVDKDGYPYILHPLTVGLMGETDEEKAAGFLHDVVEDTGWSLAALREAGISEGVVAALALLTHDKSLDYFDYVRRIIDSGNPIALKVKYHDLLHNYARGKAYPRLQEKHGKALEMVKAAVEGRSKVRLYEPADGACVAIFAGGCFWGVQHEFDKEPGVLRTLAGYTGGPEEAPGYVDVRAGRTHHVEAVAVEYDPARTDYTTLCKVFFEMHDPSREDGVGTDKGPQYRSCIFVRDEKQKTEAQAVIDILKAKGYEVATLLLPAGNFWIAEDFHQSYYDKTGGTPYCHLRQKKF